jgi:repressor of nif and glnA expression
MSQPKIQDKHIEQLTRSKPSGIKIGSRSVPHRLKQFERKKYEQARKYGYLMISNKDRKNIVNVWNKYCLATKKDAVVVTKNITEKTAVILKNGATIFEGSIAKAKEIILSLYPNSHKKTNNLSQKN